MIISLSYSLIFKENVIVDIWLYVNMKTEQEIFDKYKHFPNFYGIDKWFIEWFFNHTDILFSEVFFR